jgi:hypothetical protein
LHFNCSENVNWQIERDRQLPGVMEGVRHEPSVIVQQCIKRSDISHDESDILPQVIAHVLLTTQPHQSSILAMSEYTHSFLHVRINAPIMSRTSSVP